MDPDNDIVYLDMEDDSDDVLERHARDIDAAGGFPQWLEQDCGVDDGEAYARDMCGFFGLEYDEFKSGSDSDDS